MTYFEALSQAMQHMLSLQYLGALMIGILVGAVVGFLPGMGGVVGVSLMLPFIYEMDPYLVPPLMMGMMGILRTIDSIPAVMFSIPGTAGSAATILDGYAMAKKGEAGRALGAAFSASMIGGLIGCFALLLSVPLARPLIMACGSPEFFMLSMLGVTMVGVLSGRRPLKGIAVGILGMLLATIGGAPGVSSLRYTFDLPYLYNGIPLVIMALGVYAIPEMVFVVVGGSSISNVTRLTKGAAQGFRDTLSHWWLVLRCAVIGTFIGFVPGLGSGPANWIAYGHAVQSSRDAEKFGKGDVRGVIAPESANNAADGAAVIPTLLFGVPGSPTMAIFIGGLIVMGINPGPEMVTVQLPFVFLCVITLAFANVLGAVLCTIFVKPISRITTVPIHYLMPFLLMTIILAAYQGTRHWGDLIPLLILFCLGWTMKVAEWPRPPMLIGFELGRIAERYLRISVVRYGASWLLNPVVIFIGIFIIGSFLWGVRKQRKSQSMEEEGR